MVDVTCYTIISRDVGLLEWCIKNACVRAGMEHNWLVIGWDPTTEVREWCNRQGVPIHSFEPIPQDRFFSRTSWFLRNLYCGWNMGYAYASTKWVVRMGSDQFFSHNWLRNLMEAAEKHGERGIYHTWTVESDLARHSRHEMRNWGTSWDEFNKTQFDLYSNDLIYRTGSTKAIRGDECDLWYRHPARGKQRRPDGVTWLQTKALWGEFGPLEDGINVEGVTGDVAYMDRLYDGVTSSGREVAPVCGYLVPRSVSYHLVRGESRDVQESGAQVARIM